MSNKGGGFESFLVGVVLGGFLGVLLAPQEGSKSRKKLKEMIEEWRENAPEEVDSFLNMLKERSDSVRGNIEDVKEKFEDSVEDVKKEVKPKKTKRSTK